MTGLLTNDSLITCLDLTNRNLHLQGDTILLKLFMAKEQTSANEQVQITQETEEPSKIQTLLKELLRIALCRNDDYNLAGSSIIHFSRQLKQAKKLSKIGPLADQYRKSLKDATDREEERVDRESEIQKELGKIMAVYQGQDYASIENYFRETIRKILILGLEKNVTGAPNLSI